MKTVIFSGPSLSHERIRAVLPAQCLPPAGQGDVVSCLYSFKPDVIGIIDGPNYPGLTVWHKEILLALDNGVRVFGASGTGAVRAAEMDSQGMQGVGQIFAKLKKSEISDQDIMQVFRNGQGGCSRLTHPMVNLRATFAQACRQGVLDDSEYKAMLWAADSIHYRDRTLDLVFEAAAQDGLRDLRIKQLREYFYENYVDLQQKDALEMLEVIKSLPDKEIRAHYSRMADDGDYLIPHMLKYRDRVIHENDLTRTCFSLGDFVMLNHPRTDRLILQAKNRKLVQFLADIMEIQVSDKEVQEEESRCRKRLGVTEQDDFSSWLQENHLFYDEFRQIMKENSRMRRLHAWLKTRMGYRRFTRMILDELKLNNEYPHWVRLAFEQTRAVQGKDERINDLFARADLKELIAKHLKRNKLPWHDDFMNIIRESGVTPDSLKMELAREKVQQEHQHELLKKALD